MPDADAAPAVDPAARYGLVEADHICACGYNLHGQRIVRDDRLDLSVVRCPECGRWNAAGLGSTAAQLWLRRLGTLALFAYVLAILGLCGGVALLCLILNVAWFENHTVDVYLHPTDGRLVDQLYSFSPAVVERTQLPGVADVDATIVGNANNAGQYLYLDDLSLATFPENTIVWHSYVNVGHAALPPEHLAAADRPSLALTGLFAAPLAIVGLIAGVFNAALLWHVKGWRTLTLAVVTLAVSAAVWALVAVSDGRDFGYALREVALAVAVSQGSVLVGWLIGLLVGRPIARATLSILLPPRPRQAMAALWLADGKPVPTA